VAIRSSTAGGVRGAIVRTVLHDCVEVGAAHSQRSLDRRQLHSKAVVVIHLRFYWLQCTGCICWFGTSITVTLDSLSSLHTVVAQILISGKSATGDSGRRRVVATGTHDG
jgi:hypothetical protein